MTEIYGKREETTVMTINDIKNLIYDKTKHISKVNKEATLTNFLLNTSFGEASEFFDFIKKNEKSYNRKHYTVKSNKNKLLFTSIRNSIVSNDIKYSICKINAIFTYMFGTNKSLFNTLINTHNVTTNFLIDRKCVLVDFNDCKFTLHSNCKDIPRVNDKINLYPFQIAKYPNGKSSKKIEYKVKNKLYNNNYDFLYYIDKRIIFRIKPFCKLILEDNVLEHKDFLLNCWETEEQNCVVYYQIELIDREITNFNLRDTVNTKHSVNKFIEPNIANLVVNKKQYNPTSKLEKLLNAEKLTEYEIDNLFNPKVSYEPIAEPQKNIINESDSDSDNDNSDCEFDTVTKIETEINKNGTFSVRSTKTDLFKLEFSYNKYYDFTEETQIIEQSIKSLYETNEKFKKLIIDYDTIRILKTVSKSYTNQRYFNFILSNKEHNFFSPQYHSYLNNNNEIVSLTKIENILC